MLSTSAKYRLKSKLEQIELRDQLMLSLMEQDQINPELCSTYQEELWIRYKLIAQLIDKS
jgi:hypothetical protein